MIPDDNLDVQELEHRYPSVPSMFVDGLITLGYLAALAVLGLGAVGAAYIVYHFIAKVW